MTTAWIVHTIGWALLIPFGIAFLIALSPRIDAADMPAIFRGTLIVFIPLTIAIRCLLF